VSLITTAGTYDCFVVKLDAGGVFAWAKSFGGPSFDDAQALALGPADQLFITGAFDGTSDLDPGSGSFPVTGNGVADVYALVLDDVGEFMNARVWGGSGLETGTSAAWSPLGRQFVGGLFELTVDFDPGPGTDVISSLVNSRDAFLTRLCTSYSTQVDTVICFGDSLFAAGEWQHLGGIFTDPFTAMNGCDSIVVTFLAVEVCEGFSSTNNTDNISLYPIPTHDVLHIALPASINGRISITVLDALGRIVIQRTEVPRAIMTLNMVDLPGGNYALQLTDEHEQRTFRFLKE